MLKFRITVSEECKLQSRFVASLAWWRFCRPVVKNTIPVIYIVEKIKMDVDEEKEFCLPVAVVERGIMSSKRQFLKLEFWSSPKVIGCVSLAWAFILLIYLGRAIVCYSIPLNCSLAYNLSVLMYLYSRQSCIPQEEERKEERYTSPQSKQ